MSAHSNKVSSKYDFLGENADWKRCWAKDETRNYWLFVFAGGFKGHCLHFIKFRMIRIAPAVTRRRRRADVRLLLAGTGDRGNSFLPAAAAMLPYPLNAPHRHSFCVARSGIYHLFRALRLKPGETVLVPDYHSGNEVAAIRAAGATVVHYPIRRNLEPDMEALSRMVKRIPRASSMSFTTSGGRNR